MPIDASKGQEFSHIPVRGFPQPEQRNTHIP